MSGYIETRAYIPNPSYPLEALREKVNCPNKEVVDKYIAEYNKKIENGRVYLDIGRSNNYDSLFELEAMGLSMYSKEYQVILDFSNHLDYILHRMTGCNPDNINRLPNYHDVSYALLNYDFSRINDLNISVLFGLDPKLDQKFEEIAKDVKEQCDDVGDSLTQKIAYTFLTGVLDTIVPIRDYVAIYVKQRGAGTKGEIKYRSKNFSSALLTSSSPFVEDILIHQDPFMDLTLHPKCYKRYEYGVKEVFCCGSCRRCKDRIR